MSNAIRKLSQLYDEADEAWSDIYAAPSVAGGIVTATVPREDQTPGAVGRHLLRKGAQLPSQPGRQNVLAAAIAEDAPVVRRAAQTGWRDRRKTFVSHRCVAGLNEAGSIIPPLAASAASVGQLDIRGDIEGWKALAEIGAHSTAMMVSLCAIFAAPLLAVVRRPPFAVMLFGPSRCGKSTAQLVGASAMGFGREEDLPNLNATPAGLLAAGLAFSDHGFPINEVGTARGLKRDTPHALRDCTYALMGGRDVLRHPSWTGGGTNAPSTFQILPLLSSEHSPDAWAARYGEAREQGEMARLIGVPVLVGNAQTVFDKPPRDLSGDDLHRWERKQFHRLRRGLPQHRGVAFRDYCEALVRDRKTLGKRARSLVRRFERKFSGQVLSAIALDIVAKFGVLYAGGLIAIEAEILPITRKDVSRAIEKACRLALAELPDPTAELAKDLRQLKERLSGGGIVNLDDCSAKQRRMIHDADGYRQSKNAGIEFVVRAQAFVGWFATALQTRRILEWLDNEGFLDHGRERSSGRSNEWAQKQVTWPDGSRQRSITIFLPRGLAELGRDT